MTHVYIPLGKERHDQLLYLDKRDLENTHVNMYCHYFTLVMTSIVKSVLSDHAWAKKKWPLNRGGLLIEVKMYGKATIGT